MTQFYSMTCKQKSAGSLWKCLCCLIKATKFPSVTSFLLFLPGTEAILCLTVKKHKDQRTNTKHGSADTEKKS